MCHLLPPRNNSGKPNYLWQMGYPIHGTKIELAKEFTEQSGEINEMNQRLYVFILTCQITNYRLHTNSHHQFSCAPIGTRVVGAWMKASHSQKK
jgi:hypothetical protein